jgi:two-component system sensor histidine kinase PilS (NtrC family)
VSADSGEDIAATAVAEPRRKLARLMAARLGLMFAVFAGALLWVGAGRRGAEAAEEGLYGTLAFAFVSSAMFAALLARVRRTQHLAAAQLAADLAVITSILFFTDGARSLFSFLYLPLTVYAAMLFERKGAYAMALAASLCVAGLLVVEREGLFGAELGAAAWEVHFGVWGAHTAALLLVAMLASTLARETRDAEGRLATSAQDLRELHSLHERTVASLTSGLVTVDPNGLVMSCNPEGTQILGRGRQSIVGEPLERLVPGVTALIEQGAPVLRRGRVALALPGGEQRHLGVAASVLNDSAGAAAGHVVIFQDVTEVVALERALVQRERLAAVGELAAGVAHEVRNPLAAISGCVEMLRALNRERSGDLEQERLMATVLREIERLDALISDFLLFARPAPPKLEAVGLHALLCEVAEMCRAACPPGLVVRVEVPETLSVEADPKQLRQVIWNLVRNAVEAVGERGEIRLAAEPQASAATHRSGSASGRGGVAIVVADDGPGIEPAAIERIFDPFFTTKPAGTGLGLATVHRIVSAHGGSVQVESTPGAGTRFRVLLPAKGAR